LDLLDILVNAHLLQNPAPDVYRFHDLLGEFAAECAEREDDEDEQRACRLRILEWYHAALHRANTPTGPRPHADPAPLSDAPLPEFAGPGEALAWTSAHLAAIHHAVKTAAEIRPQLSWQIANCLFTWTTTNWGVAGEWEQPFHDALAAAERVGDLKGQARMQNMLGVAHGCSFRNETSLVYFRTAAALYEQLGVPERQAQVLANYGTACGQAGRVEEGLKAMRRAIELRGPAAAPTASFLHPLGTLLLAAGDAAAAEAVFRQCLKISRADGQVLHEGISLVTLGDSLRALDRREEAVACIEESLRIYRRLGNDFHTADGLEALARTHFHFGDHEQARDTWNQALAIARDHRIERVREDCLKGLAALDS
ncbi:tetratricopeptide repeat protein, partial [Streptomyces sp. NPDC000075]